MNFFLREFQGFFKGLALSAGIPVAFWVSSGQLVPSLEIITNCATLWMTERIEVIKYYFLLYRPQSRMSPQNQVTFPYFPSVLANLQERRLCLWWCHPGKQIIVFLSETFKLKEQYIWNNLIFGSELVSGKTCSLGPQQWILQVAIHIFQLFFMLGPRNVLCPCQKASVCVI